MNYKTISKDDFMKLSLEEQIEIVNNGLKEEKTLQKVCDRIGVARKHWSEKFRRSGYVFSKVDKGFFKSEEIESTDLKQVEENKETKTGSKKIKAVKNETAKVKKVVEDSSQHNINTDANNTINNNASVSVVSSFDFYYEPSGIEKKMGASVDAEVLKEFEKICNKYKMGTSIHITNAIALYVQKMNSK